MKTTTSEIKAHAEFSASGSHRWLNCPGSMALCAKAPPARESKYAEEGTEAHACFEFILNNRAQLDTAVKMARQTWSDIMVEHALDATEYVLSRATELNSTEILCETKIDSSYFTMTGQFGTLDAAVVAPFDTLIVIDYKYGAGVAVDPEGEDGKGNSQLVYYALGVSKLYDHAFDKIELVVIQPRAFHPSGETVRTFEMQMDELLEWIPIFRNGVMETSDPHAELRAGSWCKFCNGATICPKLKNESFTAAKIVFSEAEPIGAMVIPEPALMQLPHLGRMLEACDKLQAWIGKVRDHAYHVLEHGGKVDGWKLVDKKSPRRWLNPDLTAIKAGMEFGDEAFTPGKLLSPAKLEKAFTKKVVASFLEENTTNESSGRTLVQSIDKRPDAVKKITDVFDIIPN